MQRAVTLLLWSDPRAYHPSHAMSDLTPLVSHDATASLTAAKKKSLLAAVTKELGKDWKAEPLDDALGLPLLHVPTKLRFRLIPGGSFTMGLTAEDIEQCEQYAGDYPDEIVALKKRATPLRQVSVAPFLITEQPLDHKTLKRLLPGYEGDELPKRKTALEVAERHGFRLPSEAELEWLARNGTEAAFVTDLVGTKALSFTKDGSAKFSHKKSTSRFGVKGLLAPLWAADDWHPNYKGAPTDSEPWMGGKADGVVRFANLSDILCAGDEMVWGFLSAMREKPGEPGQVLLVVPLSRWVAASPRSVAVPTKQTVRGTKAVKGKVDWKSLKTKKGTAAQLPKLLAKVAAGGTTEDPVGCELWEIFDQVITRKGLGAAAAPLIEEALRLVPKAKAPEMLLVVVSQVVGNDQMRNWLTPVTAPTHQPILSVLEDNRELLLACLESKNAAVCSCAAMVLMSVGEWRAQTVPLLTKLVVGKSEALVCASACLALARLGADDEKCVATLHAMAKNPELPDALRGSAALAWLRAQPTHPYSEVKEGIAAWFRLGLRPPCGGEQPDLPFGWFGALGAENFFEQRPSPWPFTELAAARNDVTSLLDCLLEVAKEPHPVILREISPLVMKLGGFEEFPGVDEKSTLLPKQFRPSQQALLPRLADALVPIKASYGLPACGAVRRRWLGLDPAGPLERLVGSGKNAKSRWQLDDGEALLEGLTRLERWRVLVENACRLYRGKFFLGDQALADEVDQTVCDDQHVAYATPIIDEVAKVRHLAMAAHEDASGHGVNALTLVPFLRAKKPIRVEWVLPLHYRSPHVTEILGALSEKQLVEHVLWVWGHYACPDYWGFLFELVPNYAAAKALLQCMPKPGANGYRAHEYHRIIGSLERLARKCPDIARAMKDCGLSQSR